MKTFQIPAAIATPTGLPRWAHDAYEQGHLRINAAGEIVKLRMQDGSTVAVKAGDTIQLSDAGLLDVAKLP